MLHFPFSDFLAPPISTCQSKAENELIHPNWDISHTLQILSIRIVDVFLKSNHNSLSICVILVHTYTLATSSLYVRSVHKRGPFRIRVDKLIGSKLEAEKNDEDPLKLESVQTWAA